MLRLHCRALHGGAAGLCASCQELREYAGVRLARCPYGEAKPTCVECPIHCYERQMRERMRAVMAYAGPRMLLAHPILGFRHWLDGLKPVPARPRKERTV